MKAILGATGAFALVLAVVATCVRGDGLYPAGGDYDEATGRYQFSQERGRSTSSRDACHLPVTQQDLSPRRMLPGDGAQFAGTPEPEAPARMFAGSVRGEACYVGMHAECVVLELSGGKQITVDPRELDRADLVWILFHRATSNPPGQVPVEVTARSL